MHMSRRAVDHVASGAQPRGYGSIVAISWEHLHKGVVTDQWPASTHSVAPGTAFALPIVLICELLEGNLVKIREYFDLLTLLEPDAPHKLYA